ncbi:MAG: hypothetical protein IJ109_08375 [Firmicutes bacterium]|nr:hypothetical protein [Bacillota bacterium]
MPKVKREVKKAEAVRWMKILGVNSDVIELFKKKDIVMSCSGITGAITPLDDLLLKQQIREFEQQWDDLVYLVVRTPSSFGWLDSLLFVDNYEDEWELVRKDLSDGYVLTWTINQDNPICSDMGSIVVRRTNSGGLIRLA